jgi:hypothetical protein
MIFVYSFRHGYQNRISFRFNLTPEQENIPAQTFGQVCFSITTSSGCVLMPGIRGRSVSVTTRHALKKQQDFSWLCEISGVQVQQSLRHLQTVLEKRPHLRIPSAGAKPGLANCNTGW